MIFFWKDGHVDEADADPDRQYWKRAVVPSPPVLPLDLGTSLESIALQESVFERVRVRMRMAISLAPFDGLAFVELGHPGVTPIAWKCVAPRYVPEYGRTYVDQAGVERAFLLEQALWNSPEWRAARERGPAAVEERRTHFLDMLDRIARHRGMRKLRRAAMG